MASYLDRAFKACLGLAFSLSGGHLCGLEQQIASSASLDDADVAWAGGRYLAVWSSTGTLWNAYVSQTAGFNTPSPVVLSSMIDSVSGKAADVVALPVPPPVQLDRVTAERASTAPTPLAVTSADVRQPVLTYDPLSQQVLVLYQSTTSGVRSLYDPFRNYDVWLKDSSPRPLHTSADDDTAAPYYDRLARPYQALSGFTGENAQGVWKLYICDVVPGGNDGAYNRSQLLLASQAAAQATSGTWFYALPGEQDADYLQQTFSVYGVDAVGNRTTQPIALTYQLDIVPPTLTVTSIVPEVSLLNQPSAVLGGQVSDGSGLAEVYVRVDPSNGASYWIKATRSGSDWSLALQFSTPGTYTFWIEARDGVGNITSAGPYTVLVPELARVHFPFVARNWTGLPGSTDGISNTVEMH